MRLGMRIKSPAPRPHEIIHAPSTHVGGVRVSTKGASTSIGPVWIGTRPERRGGGVEQGVDRLSGAAGAIFGRLMVTVLALGFFVWLAWLVLRFVWRWVVVWPHTLVSDVLSGPQVVGWGLTVAGWALIVGFVGLIIIGTGEDNRQKPSPEAAEQPTPASEPEPAPEVTLKPAYVLSPHDQAQVEAYRRWATSGNQPKARRP